MFSERIHLTNSADSVSADAGYRPRQEVRSVAVDAYIGTSAGMLVIPESLRATLGLETVSTRPVEIADGTTLECAVTEPVTDRKSVV